MSQQYNLPSLPARRLRGHTLETRSLPATAPAEGGSARVSDTRSITSTVRMDHLQKRGLRILREDQVAELDTDENKAWIQHLRDIQLPMNDFEVSTKVFKRLALCLYCSSSGPRC